MNRVTANGVDFAYLEEGPADGPLALCLHGFPDSAHSFRFLLPGLGRAGFHAVAPFLRGYAPTAVPADGAYGVDSLAADANGLHAALGGDGRAVLIGHDWGAITAYAASATEPERWRRVVAAAVPPPGATASGFLNYHQLKRSFYMFFFQHPLADVVVGLNDFEFIDNLWADWSPGYAAAEDLGHVKDALRDPANLGAALGYYRAMFGGAGPSMAGPGPQPCLYLHGRNDGCLAVDMAAGAESQLPAGSKSVVVENAGHFLVLEQPDEVNRVILDWVTT